MSDCEGLDLGLSLLLFVQTLRICGSTEVNGFSGCLFLQRQCLVLVGLLVKAVFLKGGIDEVDFRYGSGSADMEKCGVGLMFIRGR